MTHAHNKYGTHTLIGTLDVEGAEVVQQHACSMIPATAAGATVT
jgi:hypothetical protein